MITVIIAHYNRSTLLNRTLFSFTHNKHSKFEIIVVDDGSIDSEICAIKKLQKKYNQFFKINIIYLKRDKKWYDNPCIPFNIGIRQAQSEIVILQSAECIHLGNVIDYTTQNLLKGNYFSYSCYSLDRSQTESLNEVRDYSPHELLSIVNPPNNSSITNCEERGWYNHPVYRPLGFHWCNAYFTEDLKEIKMFDERFATGIAYDDDELSFRSRRDLNLTIVDTPIVLHQWHGLNNYFKKENQAENQIKQNYNRSLFEQITKKEPDNKNVKNDLSLTVEFTVE